MTKSIESYAINYIKHALIFLMIGIAMGLYMAMTLDYTHRVSHVHLLMLGFIIQGIYAVIIKQWLLTVEPIKIKRQFWCHQAGTILTVVGFILIFGRYLHPAISGIITGIGSVLVLAAAFMLLTLIKNQTQTIR